MKNKFLLILLTIICISNFSVAETNTKILAYEDLDFILQNYVNDKGQINFQDLKQNKDKLTNFINSASQYPINEYSNLNEKQQIIFWIQIYNALMLDFGANNYPIKTRSFTFLLYPKNSIKHLGKSPKISIIIFNKEMSLKEIENKIIELGGIQSIFTLTNLTKSSPIMRNSIYKWEFIPRDITEQLFKFVFDQNNYYLDKENNILYLSGFFKKHQNLFTIKNENLPKFLTDSENKIINFLIDYIWVEDRDYLMNSTFYRVKFKDFDYRINDFVVEKELTINDLI